VKTPALIHVYLTARRKRHGAGACSRADALRLGIHAQFISWGCPRWMIPIMRLTEKDFPAREWLRYFFRRYVQRERRAITPTEHREYLRRPTLSLWEIAHLTYGLRPPPPPPDGDVP
jgi:hypothetical protein